MDLGRLPPRLRAPLRQVLTVLGTSLWVGPTIAALVAIGLALALLEVKPPMDWLPLALDDAQAARSSLSAVIAATVAAISLVGTGTIVALQLAAGQYSPRLLRGVLDDGAIRAALSGLVGVIVYAMVVLTATTQDDIPTAAVALGMVLGMIGVGLLVLFIHQIAGRVRLESLLDEVTRDTLAAVDGTHPLEGDHDADTSVPDHARALEATRSGYLQAVSLDALAKAASAHGVHLRVRPRVGTFLVRGTTMAWVWPTGDADADVDDAAHDDLADAVDQALALGVDRTVESDPAYGIRHLVDVGLRAISPAVNDPTTATQCIHHATSVLVALGDRRLHDGVATHEGSLAIVARPDLADHLELAQTQLLQYGGDDARIVEALADQLRDLAEATDLADDLVRTHLERLREDADTREHLPHTRDVIDAAFTRVTDSLTGDTPDDEDDDPAAG